MLLENVLEQKAVGIDLTTLGGIWADVLIQGGGISAK